MGSIAESLLAGAATGAAEANIKSTAEQNQQVMHENLAAQEGAINNMYQERLQEHQMYLQSLYRQGAQAAVMPQVKAELASMGMVMPGETPGAGQKVADPKTMSQVLGNAYAEKGYVPGEEVYKGGTGITSSDVRAQEMLLAAERMAWGQQHRGETAAGINADASKYSADQRLLAAKANAGRLERGDALKILGDPLLRQDPSLVSQAQSVLNGPNGLLSSPNAPPAPTTPAPAAPNVVDWGSLK